MSGYVYFTEEQKQRANAVDLVYFLERQGEKLIKSGRDRRLESNHSITVRGNEWFDHAEGSKKGGLAIDFVRYHYGLSFPDAVSLLLGGEQGVEYRKSEPKQSEPRKPFELPKANANMRRVFAYLMKTRLLDREVVMQFVKANMLYEDADYHNAVFVGYDKDGVARHAHKRGTVTGPKAYKGNVESCDPRFSFHYVGTSDTVYVFEAPIDMLSFITMYQRDWRRHSYVALCCVAEHALIQMLEDYPNIQKIGLCLDHDKAGMKAVTRITGILAERGYPNVFPLFSVCKDWNEDIKVAHGVEALPAKPVPCEPEQPTDSIKLEWMA